MATGLTAIIGAVTSVVTASIDWMTSFGQAIVETPILLLYVCVPLVGLGIGIFKRLIRAA
jgi:hypothetical protein